MSKRIYLQENPDIRFEKDKETGQTIMFVCGEEFLRKNLPLFSPYFVRKHFRREIDQHKDFICPTDLAVEEHPKQEEG